MHDSLHHFLRMPRFKVDRSVVLKGQGKALDLGYIKEVPINSSVKEKKTDCKVETE